MPYYAIKELLSKNTGYNILYKYGKGGAKYKDS